MSAANWQIFKLLMPIYNSAKDCKLPYATWQPLDRCQVELNANTIVEGCWNE